MRDIERSRFVSPPRWGSPPTPAPGEEEVEHVRDPRYRPDLPIDTGLPDLSRLSPESLANLPDTALAGVLRRLVEESAEELPDVSAFQSALGN
ncbi:hypothetical protein GCM10027160_01740 [Streptomyces calidiresistens]